MLCSYNKNALDDDINKVLTSENIKEENKTIEEEKEPIMVAVNYQNDTKKLDLEEYVFGVVSCEMPASFEMEALKAMAVVSRTFALY